ncbi:hypothetical protein GCM10009725_23930 [Aeromicrobium tamlense]
MRVAVEASGAHRNALPKPSSALSTSSCQTGVSGAITRVVPTIATEDEAKPTEASQRGCIRSLMRPTTGAIAAVTTAIGTNSRPACVASKPSTVWVQSMNGNAIAVTENETAEMPRVDTEKFRSRKRLSGTSGSRRLRACQATNTARTTRPAAMSSGTESRPSISPQSYFSPSWMPKTMRNIAMALSTTPTQSNWWLWVSSAGTSRHASAKPTMPTGTLMMKIHSQPALSTSTPPRTGPTSVATPAVAPHSAIARPRLAGGKVRVMTAIVCGVIIEAPRPCTTRAMISHSTESVRPHHSEDRVKTARPVR